MTQEKMARRVALCEGHVSRVLKVHQELKNTPEYEQYKQLLDEAKNAVQEKRLKFDTLLDLYQATLALVSLALPYSTNP